MMAVSLVIVAAVAVLHRVSPALALLPVFVGLMGLFADRDRMDRVESAGVFAGYGSGIERGVDDVVLGDADHDRGR